jgi:FkbM family methyltransferase
LLWGNIWFGANQIDKSLSKFVGTKRGYFVELGGNDGVTQSNTKHLELFRGWRGVLIEPYPRNFQLMANNRSPRSRFVNAACVSFEYPDTEMLLSYANLMTTPLQGESDIVDRNAHAASGSVILPANEVAHKFKAKALNLTKILDDCGSPKIIDLLSLDVEGGELEVLKGIDHDKYRFRWMVVENRSPLALEEFLNSKGYSLVCQLSGKDYVYRDTPNV